MSDLDYDALRKVAEAAEGEGIYPDTWWGQPGNRWALTPPRPDLPPEDVAHIATFDPPTVLRLLDLAQRAEADRAAVERVRRVSEYWDLSEFPHEATATAMRSELIAALDPKEDQ